MFLLTTALKHLPVGTAYAIWTGIGSLGVTLIGIAAFHESASPLRLLCIAAIMGGIIGLKVMESSGPLSISRPPCGARRGGAVM